LLFESLHGLSRSLVTDSLFSRERLGSTGLGHGVAIPHGRIKGLKAPMAAVFLLATRSASMPRTTRRCAC
jgi:PTS system nitrogen regulatory IIA component